MTKARILADYVAGGVTAAEFDVLDGLTSTTAELNRLDGITSAAVGLTDSQTLTNKTLTSPVVNTPSLPTFVGMIASFGMASAPTGWIICDGAAVSRTVTYDALFAVISTTWGVGNGSSTFNLPDLRGAFLRGVGTSTAFTYDTTVTLAGVQDDMYQNHRHAIWSSISGATGTGSGAVNYAATSPGTFQYYTYNAQMAESNHPQADGSPRIGAETRPNNLGVTFCIKY